jgi:hypothetical protein
MTLTAYIFKYHLIKAESARLVVVCKRTLKPVFHIARIVAKHIGEHAQIEKRFINPRTSGCTRVSK